MGTHLFSLGKNPWVYFFIFLLANTLIAYAGFSTQLQLALGLFGIALPFYVASRTTPTSSRSAKPFYAVDLKLPLSGWLLALAVLVAVGLRFYKLETLFRWPTLDEGWNGTLAIELSKHWTWKFFYTFGEAPPLPVWCAAGLFNIGASPALALWFPSAVVSLLTVPAGYFAARHYFSKSFAYVGAGLLAFSYWPLFIGRFCHQGIWLPLWVCLFLWAWGNFLNTSGGSAKRKGSILLGLALGFGSFTFTPWLGVAGFFFASMAWIMIGGHKKDWRSFSYFSGALLISLLPFLSAVYREGYGHHIASLSPWGGWFKDFHILTGFFKYFAVLVWGSFEKDPAYTPLWGGFLNPLLGSFFFLGLLSMFQLRRFKPIQWTAAAFLLFLLPGALSPNLESFRIAQVMPLLLVITALGIYFLLTSITAKSRPWFLAGVLAFTGAFDFNLLAAPYRNPEAHPENFGRPLKSLERYRAFNLLRESKANIILTDYDTDSYNDPTLSVMTYPFNAERGGGQTPPARIGLFVNVHYMPFLKKRFPQGEFHEISAGLGRANGGNFLMTLLEFKPGKGFPGLYWIQLHSVFQRANLARFQRSAGSMEKSIAILEFEYTTPEYTAPLKSDPFLASVYWDRRASFEYEDLNYEEQLRSYQMAVSLGYPTADLFFKLGELYRVKGHWAEARAAYLRATQAPLDLTNSRGALEWLKINHP